MTWPEVFEQRLTGEWDSGAGAGREQRAAGSLASSTSPGHRHHRRRQKQPRPTPNDASSPSSSSPLTLALVNNNPPPPAAAQTAAAATLSAATLYATARLGVEVYKNLRRRALRRLLLDTCPVLDALSTRYYVDFGTLLGLHREKDVILHDNDADVVLLEPDFDALLPRLAEALPQFRVCSVVPSEDASVRWLRVIAGPLGAPVGVMDLYGGWRSECGKHIGIPQGHGDLCDVPASLVLPLGRMRWRGANLACPADVEGVLAHRYGPSWRVPRYMDKGRDEVEQGKPYVKVLTALGKVGLRI
jgi:hypothetical protein